MSRFVLYILGALVFVAAVFVGTTFPAAQPAASPLSTVKVVVGEGHGSGVHIGRGLILTAAHVVESNKTVQVKLTDDSTAEGTVLWANADYDVALVHVEMLTAATSPLACRLPIVGEEVYAFGSPGPLDFIRTWGRVSADARQRAAWKAAFILDATVAPGMSGGPVFDAKGNVIGLVVAVIAVPTGFSRSLIPITFVVSAPAICRLLAR